MSRIVRDHAVGRVGRLRFGGLRVDSYCIMSNHFHILVEVPQRPDTAALPDDAGLVAKVRSCLGDKLANIVFNPIRAKICDDPKNYRGAGREAVSGRFSSLQGPLIQRRRGDRWESVRGRDVHRVPGPLRTKAEGRRAAGSSAPACLGEDAFWHFLQTHFVKPTSI